MRKDERISIYSAAMKQLLTSHDVTWSKRNKYCSDHGQARGQVLDQDLNPVEGATVTFCCWLNHTFRESWNGTTDEQGYFTAPGIPYGICGICGEKEGESGFITRKTGR